MKLRRFLLPILAFIFAFAPMIHAQSDSDQQQHAANMLAGMGVGFLLIIFLVVIAFMAFMIFLLWRIFTKAGMSGALSLLVFIPGFGGLIVLCILAFADWKVVPAAQYVALPPAYPPPPSYPPAV